MTIHQALEDALDYIEAINGSTFGDVYNNASQALGMLEGGRGLDEEMPAREVACAKCGEPVATEEAVTDEGEGPEAGRTFFYCSDDCKDRH